MINAYCSEVHYLNKLLPIWNSLPSSVRGTFKVHPRLDGQHGFSAGRPDQDGTLMVASAVDSKWAKTPYIYVEHGAGQAYGSSTWYSARYRPNMLAALVPGPYCAEQTQAANPHALVIPIGAPHLRNVVRKGRRIVFAWHWRCSVAIEANTAFDEYAEAIPEVAEIYEIAGHGHPRILNELRPYYEQHGIEICETPEEALGEAGLLVADNTSLIYEAAALDIPVVLVNGSQWRRDKSWGLRFWDAIPGPQVNAPSELLRVIKEQVEGGFVAWKEMRTRVANLVYGPHPFNRLEPGIEALLQVIDANSD